MENPLFLKFFRSFFDLKEQFLLCTQPAVISPWLAAEKIWRWRWKFRYRRGIGLHSHIHSAQGRMDKHKKPYHCRKWTGQIPYKDISRYQYKESGGHIFPAWVRADEQGNHHWAASMGMLQERTCKQPWHMGCYRAWIQIPGWITEKSRKDQADQLSEFLPLFNRPWLLQGRSCWI